jgi:hypothetical protein
MSTTIGRLTEQIQKILQGGRPNGDSRTTDDEVKLLVAQVANQLLKIDRLNTNFAEGDYFPPFACIATYDNIAVETYKGKSRALLPAFPMNLPHGMGIWTVSPTDDLDDLFIPLPTGMWAMLKSIDVVDELNDKIGYEPDGHYIVFTKDITAAPTSIDEVCVRLVTIEPGKLDDYDILPVPADMEAQIIAGVLQILGVEKPKDDTVDGNSKA